MSKWSIALAAALALPALLAAPAASAYVSEQACAQACGAHGSCGLVGASWECVCEVGYEQLSGGPCADIDECVASYESHVFASLEAYRNAVTTRGFTQTGVETFDDLGPGGTASTSDQPVTVSPTLGVSFAPLWQGLTVQPAASPVGSCGGTTSSGLYALLNNDHCTGAWAGSPAPAIAFSPLDPDVAIVGAGVFNASVDDVLLMTFYAADGTVLITATIPKGAPAFVGVVAQVPASRVSIGPAPNNPGNGLIAFDNLELALQPLGHVGGELCGDDATCVNTEGGYTCVSDDCPNDPDKDVAGVCGCGQPETDADGDGVIDCGYGQCPRDLPATVACGTVGVCASIIGNQVCDIMTGVITNDCPVLDATETCDGHDDDCDGEIDEGFDPTCGPGPGKLFYAIVTDASGAPVGTIRCHDDGTSLDCDRDPNVPGQLRVYPELICPAGGAR